LGQNNEVAKGAICIWLQGHAQVMKSEGRISFHSIPFLLFNFLVWQKDPTCFEQILHNVLFNVSKFIHYIYIYKRNQKMPFFENFINIGGHIVHILGATWCCEYDSPMGLNVNYIFQQKP
jgi:hypothetical protein